MFLTTKQVRAIAKVGGFDSAYWTDKTSERDATRRSVVWHCYSKTEADRLYNFFKTEFAKQGVANTVKRTGVAGNWATQETGGEYVRVIATLG